VVYNHCQPPINFCQTFGDNTV